MEEFTRSAVSGDIPTQIFEQYLKELTAAGISDEYIVRLRKTLLQEHTFTDRALKVAILDEGQVL